MVWCCQIGTSWGPGKGSGRSFWTSSNPPPGKGLVQVITHVQGKVWWCSIQLQDNSVFVGRVLQLWYQPFAKHVVISLSSNSAVKEERANHMCCTQSSPHHNVRWVSLQLFVKMEVLLSPKDNASGMHTPVDISLICEEHCTTGTLGTGRCQKHSACIFPCIHVSIVQFTDV
jgi:hypothetical protein